MQSSFYSMLSSFADKFEFDRVRKIVDNLFEKYMLEKNYHLAEKIYDTYYLTVYKPYSYRNEIKDDDYDYVSSKLSRLRLVNKERIWQFTIKMHQWKALIIFNNLFVIK